MMISLVRRLVTAGTGVAAIGVLVFSVMAGMSDTRANGATDIFAGYRILDRSEFSIRAKSPEAVIAEFITATGFDFYESDITIANRSAASDILIDVKMSGYKDDSVAGENYLLRIVETAGWFLFDRIGVQYICYRGENAGAPQTGLCP